MAYGKFSPGTEGLSHTLAWVCIPNSPPGSPTDLHYGCTPGVGGMVLTCTPKAGNWCQDSRGTMLTSKRSLFVWRAFCFHTQLSSLELMV